MSKMTRVVTIGERARTITAEAGLLDVARTACFRTREGDRRSGAPGLQANTRRRLWNSSAAFLSSAMARALDGPVETLAQDAALRIVRLLVFTLEAIGGLRSLDADKTIDYHKT